MPRTTGAKRPMLSGEALGPDAPQLLEVLLDEPIEGRLP
jgi:hypothetical protein